MKDRAPSMEKKVGAMFVHRMTNCAQRDEKKNFRKLCRMRRVPTYASGSVSVLVPKFVGDTIALPDPAYVNSGPARDAILERLARRPCAPLRQVDNDFLHVAVSGVVEIVNQYNGKRDIRSL
jgi:hypothetical protein